ncbi:MAG: polyprenyl synthetase family protein [Thermoleophilia bacterium]|nr:polyprenyl synthetase family protein [Thermoleophilia bacterium]
MTTPAPDTSASTGLSGLDDLRALVERELAAAFRVHDPVVAPLAGAIEYSLLGRGKRIRPVLALAAAEAVGVELAPIVPIAASFELVHAYSLVHDDLPAMDDDDLRRGLPTSHRQFGEAIAVLVGDALQARAFELVAGARGVSAEARIDIVSVLAQAAGWRGMVGGQYLDIDETRTDRADVLALRDVHDRKTGALIAGAIEAGAVAGGVTISQRAHFASFGRGLGWLFQLVDDLLDATGSAEELGKTPGKDASSGKVTAVDAFGGIDGLRDAAARQLEECLAGAALLPNGGGRLPGIARFVYGRDH